MKNYIFNSAKGKRFFAELNGFFLGNNIPANLDIYESFLQVKFESNFLVDNDILCAMMNFARKYDMLIDIRAYSDCIIMGFSLD